MLIFSLSLVIGFIVNAVIGALVAQFIATPFVHKRMSQFEREKKDVKMGPMMGGYLLLTLVMVLFYPYFDLEMGWLIKGAILGLFSGVISFVSIYLIISGWSILPPKEMFISGLIDVIATIASGITIAYIYSF